MKEHNFCVNSTDNHIVGWTIDEKICDDLIDLFK